MCYRDLENLLFVPYQEDFRMATYLSSSSFSHGYFLLESCLLNMAATLYKSLGALGVRPTTCCKLLFSINLVFTLCHYSDGQGQLYIVAVGAPLLHLKVRLAGISLEL